MDLFCGDAYVQTRGIVPYGAQNSSSTPFLCDFLAGLIFFVINPNQDNTLLNVFLIGAFFGLVTYGTYDLTVYASMNIFSLKLVVADILWGMFLSGAVATLTVFTINKLN